MSPELLAQRLAALHSDAFGWARHCCEGNPSAAEEVMQNAYLKCLQGRLREPDPAGLKPWWLEVIRLTALEERRRQRNWLGRLERWLATGRGQAEDEARDERASPDRKYELDEESARLRALLVRLPARQGEVLHLVFYQGLSIAESAVTLGVSLGSARVHYERGKARLRKWLEEGAAP